jgi:methylisocitrate lyase
LAESVGGVRRVTGAVDVPLIADADTGYGEEAGVWRTVREFERAGASAIQIEDQIFPKRCGHMDGKAVIDRERMISKVRTACAARRDPETVIIARTDSLQAHGIDEAIDRCNLFAEAGADVVFIDAPESREQLVAAAQRVDAPAVVNTTETGRTPLLSVGELEQMGFKLIIFPSNQLWTLAGAYEELCRAVLDTGSTAPVRDRMMAFADVNELLGLADYQALEP